MTFVYLLLGVFLFTALPAEAHVVLDGRTAQQVLEEIARQLGETRDGATEEARLEALYTLGERAQSLADLMNLDYTAHGQTLYADALVQRLEALGIRIRRAERGARYVYDMAAFSDYLKRSPRGKRAAEASYRLMAEAFYASIGADPGDLVDTDVHQLQAAIRREEGFVRDFPKSDKLKAVRFFLAMDYYRLSRHSPDPATARKYGQLASRALGQIVTEYPGTPEARAAETVLDR